MTHLPLTMTQMRQALDEDWSGKTPPGAVRSLDEMRTLFHGSMVGGRLVMLDCQQASDPQGTQAALIIASEADYLVRVPLSSQDAEALVHQLVAGLR
ncbi:MAG: hypothetical protein AAF441_11640 [Pseudomonadota bacterium]